MNKVFPDLEFQRLPSMESKNRSEVLQESESAQAPQSFGHSIMRRSMTVVDTFSIEQRNRFLMKRVMKCQIWRDDGGALFVRLKEVAQDLMRDITAQCEKRSDLRCAAEICTLKQKRGLRFQTAGNLRGLF